MFTHFVLNKMNSNPNTPIIGSRIEIGPGWWKDQQSMYIGGLRPCLACSNGWLSPLVEEKYKLQN